MTLSSSSARAQRSGLRYSDDLKGEARWLREQGWSCPQIAQELGVSLRSAQVWTAGLPALLKRLCKHCGTAFTRPAMPHGVPAYCSRKCFRYAYGERRRIKRRERGWL